MLPKANRLSRPEFNAFFASGTRFHHPCLTLIYQPNPVTKAAVVVGKKVAKKAVTRNLFRRQIYAGIARHTSNSKQSGVFILITKPAFALLPRRERIQVVSEVLARSGNPR